MQTPFYRLFASKPKTVILEYLKLMPPAEEASLPIPFFRGKFQKLKKRLISFLYIILII
jgi:hypothetical protein